MDTATSLFKGLREVSSYEYENRVMILTDAQPNTGDFSSYGLMYNVKKNADSRLYTTFIGVGRDFIQASSSKSPRSRAPTTTPSLLRPLPQRIEEEFDFMVTPLVFDSGSISRPTAGG